MATFLDDRPFASSSISSQSTVAHVIEAARNDLVGTGRLLIGIRCDGDELSADRMERLIGEPATRFARLDLISDRPQRVVVDILQHARSAFAHTFELVRLAADTLAVGNGEGMSTLIACVQTWSQVHESVVKGGALLGIRFDELLIQNRSVTAWLGDLVTRLRELRGAIDARDYVLLVDLLRYEFDETLQGWETFLDAFITHVESTATV